MENGYYKDAVLWEKAETEGRISYETTLIGKVAAIRNQNKCDQ